MPKRKLSTFEREMQNPEFKGAFENSYDEFLLSELLIEIMEQNNKSVRQLAKEVHLSPTVIQNMRSGKQNDIKMSNFINIFHACGYKIILEKNGDRIPL